MYIFHGSERIIEYPEYGKGNPRNDYGRGFYCTENEELAKEWACKKNTNGFSNRYMFDAGGLSVCNLNSENYSLLNWLAVLTRNRSYWQQKSIAEDAKLFLQEKYYVDIDKYDVIIGYRADDSYFSFAQDFIMGTISYQKLARAMHLGKLGEQIVLKSEASFNKIQYQGFDIALADTYYKKKATRDHNARKEYIEDKSATNRLDEIFIIDIMRGRVSDDELRI